jgi:hypothetical protein
MVTDLVATEAVKPFVPAVVELADPAAAVNCALVISVEAAVITASPAVDNPMIATVASPAELVEVTLNVVEFPLRSALPETDTEMVGLAGSAAA